MNATLTPTTDLRQVARAAAATAPDCAVRAIIAPVLGLCDLAFFLHTDINLPTCAFHAGDTLLTNKTIEPLPGDMILVLLDRAEHRITDHAEWMALKSTERIVLSAVVVGYMRSTMRLTSS